MKLFCPSILLVCCMHIVTATSQVQDEDSKCCCRDGRDGKDGKDGKDGRDGREAVIFFAEGMQLKGEALKNTPSLVDSQKGQSPAGFLDLKWLQSSKEKETDTEVGLLKKQVQLLEERLKKLEDEKNQVKDKYKAAYQADTIGPDVSLNEFVDEVRVRNKGAELDRQGKFNRNVAPGGKGKRTLSDISWQAQHIAAASACRALTQNKGSPGIHSVVLVRNASDKKSCTEICANSWASSCEAEVSLWGMAGKAKKNGQEVANFYNYGCEYNSLGGSEASVDDDAIFNDFREAHLFLFSYCCCSFGQY